jgi:hypothetical protein
MSEQNKEKLKKAIEDKKKAKKQLEEAEKNLIKASSKVLPSSYPLFKIVKKAPKGNNKKFSV